MLNVLRPAMTRLFTPVGALLARTPVTPNAITITGTVGVVGGALVFFPRGELFPGARMADQHHVPYLAGRRCPAGGCSRPARC